MLHRLLSGRGGFRCAAAVVAGLAVGGAAAGEVVYTFDSRTIESMAEAHDFGQPKGSQSESAMDSGDAMQSPFWDDTTAVGASRGEVETFSRSAQLSRLEAKSLYFWGDAFSSAATGGATQGAALGTAASRASIGFALSVDSPFAMSSFLISSGVGSSVEVVLTGPSGLVGAWFASGDLEADETINGVLGAGSYLLTINATSYAEASSGGSVLSPSMGAYTVSLDIVPAPGGFAAVVVACGVIGVGRRQRGG